MSVLDDALDEAGCLEEEGKFEEAAVIYEKEGFDASAESCRELAKEKE